MQVTPSFLSSLSFRRLDSTRSVSSSIPLLTSRSLSDRNPIVSAVALRRWRRRNLRLVSDDSDYTSDVSYPINSQANVNYPLAAMSHSSPQTKKPLAFVQPVIRNVSRRSAANESVEEPLSYVSQPRKALGELK